MTALPPSSFLILYHPGCLLYVLYVLYGLPAKQGIKPGRPHEKIKVPV
jgi:hypothetical protein